MAVPFRVEHWNLLVEAANNFKDIRRYENLPDTYDSMFHFHDGHNQAIFLQDEQPWRNDSRTYENVLDSANIPLLETANNHLWRRSLLTPMKERIDEIYAKAQLEGTVESPWPANEDSRLISETTMRALFDAVHWSPIEYTNRWVRDTYGNAFHGFGWISGDTYVDYDLHYYIENTYWYESRLAPDDWWLDGTHRKVWITQPHTELIEVFPPDLISGAKIDWICRHDFFGNTTGIYNRQAGPHSLLIWDYDNRFSPNAYHAKTSYPIDDDGTCQLTYYDHPPVIEYWDTRTTWDVGHDDYEVRDEWGESTNPYWTCLVLNFEDAVFI